MERKVISFQDAAAKKSFRSDKNDPEDRVTKEDYVAGLRTILGDIARLSDQFDLENRDVLMDLLYLQVSSELVAGCVKEE